jgi:hypothetical protein
VIFLLLWNHWIFPFGLTCVLRRVTVVDPMPGRAVFATKTGVQDSLFGDMDETFCRKLELMAWPSQR